MAQLTFTVPNAALAALDEYAQKRQYANFHDLALDWIKNSAKNAKRERNRQDAEDLIAQEPPDVAIT